MILLLVQFWSIIGLAIVSPGPSFVVTTHTAIAKGRNAGIALAAGIGCASMVLFCAFRLGFKSLFIQYPRCEPIIHIAGFAYLLYLGIHLWLSKPQPSPTLEETVSNLKFTRTKKQHTFVTGFLTQIFNFKTFIIYGSIYTAFKFQNFQLKYFILALAGLYILEITWYSFVSLILSTEHLNKAFLSHIKILNRVCGTILIMLGLNLGYGAYKYFFN